MAAGVLGEEVAAAYCEGAIAGIAEHGFGGNGDTDEIGEVCDIAGLDVGFLQEVAVVGDVSVRVVDELLEFLTAECCELKGRPFGPFSGLPKFQNFADHEVAIFEEKDFILPLISAWSRETISISILTDGPICSQKTELTAAGSKD